MIISEKSHQNLSDYTQFLIKKDFNWVKKVIIFSDEMRNSGNYEWAKRTKFLLAVTCGSPRRHSNSSNSLKNVGKNGNTFL